jgi:hypothetical protein
MKVTIRFALFKVAQSVVESPKQRDEKFNFVSHDIEYHNSNVVQREILLELEILI